MSTLRPIGDKVLLVFPQEGRMEGGVYVMGGTDRRMDATVVACGGRVSDAVRPGATVVADRLSGIQVTLDGVAYRLVPEKEILAVKETGGK